MQRIYEKDTALTGHLQEQPDSQKADLEALLGKKKTGRVRATEGEPGLRPPQGGPLAKLGMRGERHSQDVVELGLLVALGECHGAEVRVLR